MAKPFYLKCPCGGELVDLGWDRNEEIYVCQTCRKSAEDLRHRYAAALGLAVEALENIRGESDWRVVEDLAFRALLKIKGEENPT